ncbi:MAG: Rieske 2Fe-2S domain-containing protein [Pseudomonadota bacterium]
MLTVEQNELLTRTGPDTDMGRVFREYWQPILLSRELEKGCAPKMVKILDEEFIAFRDAAGRVGVVEPRCSHRGASLFLGRAEECGVRCVYHGWKFDVEGNCIEIPTVPNNIAEGLKPKAKIKALKVKEWCDMVWVHFSDDPPELPQMDFSTLPPEHYFVSKKHQQCNWAQAVEGGLDTAHFSFLHANIKNGERVGLMPSKGVGELPENGRYRWLIEDSMPQFSILKHDSGIALCASREADNDQLYWRLTQFMMPNHSMAPNSFPGDNHQGNTWVPIDDYSCWIYCYVYNPERPLTQEERERYAAGVGIFAAVDENYIPIRNRDNDYLIDREAQQTSNLTGITGISEQDAAIADSQGYIADRTQEILGRTDLGIVRFRNMMFDAIDSIRADKSPHGRDNPCAYRVRSGDAMSGADEPALDVVNKRFGELGGVNLDKY